MKKALRILAVAAIGAAIMTTVGCASAPYKVSASKTIVVGAAKIGDPSEVKTAVFGPVMTERTVPTGSLLQTAYGVRALAARKEFVIAQEEKAQSFGAAFIAEFTNRFGPPLLLSTQRDKLDPNNVTVVIIETKGDGYVDPPYLKEAAELSQKAGASQFIVISGRLWVNAINMVGTNGDPVLTMYAVLYDNTGKQIRGVVLGGPSAKKIAPDDAAGFTDLIGQGEAAIPEMINILFNLKK